VIVEICGDDPDRGRAAKEPNDRFLKMIRAGNRIRQATFDAIMNRDAMFHQTTQVTIDQEPRSRCLMQDPGACHRTNLRLWRNFNECVGLLSSSEEDV
jgi:hypothetical protein